MTKKLCCHVADPQPSIYTSAAINALNTNLNSTPCTERSRQGIQVGTLAATNRHELHHKLLALTLPPSPRPPIGFDNPSSEAERQSKEGTSASP